MKKILLSVVAMAALAQGVLANESFSDALKNGTYSTKARVFYFDRSFDKPGVDDAQALTAGGIMKYVSGDYYGFKTGFAYYGSHRLGGIWSREEGKGTSILGRSGEDLSFLGEAYIEYCFCHTGMTNTTVKVGRQQLATPLIQNHDLRILPSVYEAAVISNKDIINTDLELGYIQAYSGFTSKDNGFKDQNAKWGKDGLGYISIKNKSIPNLSIRAQYVMPINDEDDAGQQVKIADYKYMDAKYALPFGEKTYIKAQFGGNAYNVGEDSLLYGVKAGTSFGMFDFTLLYDKIEDNEFKAVESGPMYSDWQQGYGNYEPSEAFGGQIIAHPFDGMSFKVGYVDVAADTGYARDDFSEMNIDAKYKLTNNSKLRVRYSIKDQTETASREDRDDFRIIYYLNF
jgi:hypothetical protein